MTADEAITLLLLGSLAPEDQIEAGIALREQVQEAHRALDLFADKMNAFADERRLLRDRIQLLSDTLARKQTELDILRACRSGETG